MTCGTCKHWRGDKRYGEDESGLCANPTILYRYINPFPWRDDLKIAGVGRKESDKCEEYENANIS